MPPVETICAFRMFGCALFQLSNHDCTVSSRTACACWISDPVVMPKKSLRIRESQKPDAMSTLNAPNVRVSVTNCSVGGNCTRIDGGWYVNDGGSNRSGG